MHQALDRLGAVNPRHVQLVEPRYFSGFTVDETAEVLGVSRPVALKVLRGVAPELLRSCSPNRPTHPWTAS